MANGHGGARPGAGRKPRFQDLDLQGLLSEAWPREQRYAAFVRLAEKATSDRGDSIDAMRLLLSYAYGKPIERQEISGPDGEPVQGYVTISPDDWDKLQSTPTD